MALRMGEIPTSQVEWQLKPTVLKGLINGKKGWGDLKDEDFRLDLRQKGVDMRLGLDIASLAHQNISTACAASSRAQRPASRPPRGNLR